jgi:hypothetical protein
MNAKSKWILDHMGRDLSNKNLRSTDFTNANLSYFNFSGCDLRGADFTSANLTGANFSGVKTGINPVNRTFIFVTALMMATGSVIAGLAAAQTLQFMFMSANRLVAISGILTLIFTMLFLVFMMWKGIGTSFRLLVLPVSIAAPLTGLIAYFTGGGTGTGMLYLTICLILIFIMMLAGIVARVAAGSVSNVMFVLVAVAGALFSTSIGGGIGMMIAGISCAVVSKRALNNGIDFTPLRAVVVFITAKFGTSFRNARLSSARFCGCAIHNTDFSNAKLKFVTWDHCTTVNSILPDYVSAKEKLNENRNEE